VLLQDFYMFRVPAVPITMRTTLQLTVIGITYITLDTEVYGSNSTTGCDKPPDYGQALKWKLSYISRTNIIYDIPVTVNCSTVLLMMGAAGTRNM
jgi:hypothetical protein